jgi:hypothetical protein
MAALVTTYSIMNGPGQIVADLTSVAGPLESVPGFKDGDAATARFRFFFFFLNEIYELRTKNEKAPPLAIADFNRSPRGISIKPDGTIIISDWENHRIRASKDKEVVTLAGCGTAGSTDGNAKVSLPLSLSLFFFFFFHTYPC